MNKKELNELIDDINESIQSLKKKEFGEKLIAFDLIDRINASFNDDLTQNVSKIFDLESQEHQLFKASILLYITLIEQQENIGLTATKTDNNNKDKVLTEHHIEEETSLTRTQIPPEINPVDNLYQMNLEDINFDDYIRELHIQTIANNDNKSNKTNLQIEDMKSNNPQNNTEEISKIKDKTKANNDNNQILVYDEEFITNLIKAIDKMKDLKDIGNFLNQLNYDHKLKVMKLFELFLKEKKGDSIEIKEILKFIEEKFTYLNKVNQITNGNDDNEILLIEVKKSEKPQNNTEILQITDPTIANKLSEILKVQIEILNSVGFLKAINQISENNENSIDLDCFKSFDPNYVKSNNSDNINIYQNDLKTLLKNNDVLNLVKECDNQDETRILTIINNINKDNYDELSDDARSNLFKIITFDRSIGEGDSDNMNKLLGENINEAINDKSKEIVKDFNQSYLEQLNKINTSTDDIPKENTNYFWTVLGSYANLLDPKVASASVALCIASILAFTKGSPSSSDISNFKPK
ncbi:MAG: hypothetical protein VX835_01030 [Pseudomonadota bacterium]|nr:hypothetical protein [Pseudomonadota bacterium]